MSAAELIGSVDQPALPGANAATRLGARLDKGALLQAQLRHPRRVHVEIGFDERKAHLIEAGADAFLMPSRFEPCGLNQMYSQAYGTPPIVSPVGGLRDTVEDEATGGGGFVMNACTDRALMEAIQRALNAWRNPQRWQSIQVAGMRRKFGWEAPARRYIELYVEARESQRFAHSSH